MNINIRWNLWGIFDKKDLWAIDLGFDALERFGSSRKLNSKFDERVLVHAGLS